MKELSKDLTEVYTHAGIFHADDVFSTALLNIYCGKLLQVNRVFKLPEDQVFAYDIGMGKYDHHQVDAEVRENGVKYAAFGLIWREIGVEILGSEEAAENFDYSFVQMIDIADNTGEKNPVSSIISSFNKNWDEMLVGDIYFHEAVEVAQKILEKLFNSIKSTLRAEKIVKEYLEKTPEDQEYVVFDKFAPWQEIIIPTNKKFAIFPSNRGGYNVQVVPKEFGNPEAKQDLPKEWLDEKPDGCTFVHPGLFLASFAEIEDAIKAVENIL